MVGRYSASQLCIPKKGISRPQSQFSHSCVCDRFIYSQDRSTHFIVLQQNRQTNHGNTLYKSLTDTWMKKLGLRPRNSFSGNICFEFLLLCLCSVAKINCTPHEQPDRSGDLVISQHNISHSFLLPVALLVYIKDNLWALWAVLFYLQETCLCIAHWSIAVHHYCLKYPYFPYILKHNWYTAFMSFYNFQKHGSLRPKARLFITTWNVFAQIKSESWKAFEQSHPHMWVVQAREEPGDCQHGQPTHVLQHQGEEDLADQAAHQRHLHWTGRHSR